jgi:hypothetical protein
MKGEKQLPGAESASSKMGKNWVRETVKGYS